MTTTKAPKNRVPLNLSAHKGESYNSFAALADALGVKPPKAREPKPVKCKVCGGEMTRAGSSNVYVCHNEVEVKDKEGKVTGKRECGNYTIKKAIV